MRHWQSPIIHTSRLKRLYTMHEAVRRSSGCLAYNSRWRRPSLLAMAAVTPLQNSAEVGLAGSRRTYFATGFAAHRPLDSHHLTLLFVLLVLPSITTMKSSVVTIRSSLLPFGSFPIICCSIISIFVFCLLAFVPCHIKCRTLLRVVP